MCAVIIISEPNKIITLSLFIIIIIIIIIIIVVISGHLLTKVWINKETRQHRPSLYQKAAYYIVKKSL